MIWFWHQSAVIFIAMSQVDSEEGSEESGDVPTHVLDLCDFKHLGHSITTHYLSQVT